MAADGHDQRMRQRIRSTSLSGTHISEKRKLRKEPTSKKKGQIK